MFFSPPPPKKKRNWMNRGTPMDTHIGTFDSDHVWVANFTPGQRLQMNTGLLAIAIFTIMFIIMHCPWEISWINEIARLIISYLQSANVEVAVINSRWNFSVDEHWVLAMGPNRLWNWHFSAQIPSNAKRRLQPQLQSFTLPQSDNRCGSIHCRTTRLHRNPELILSTSP